MGRDPSAVTVHVGPTQREGRRDGEAKGGVETGSGDRQAIVNVNPPRQNAQH